MTRYAAVGNDGMRPVEGAGDEDKEGTMTTTDEQIEALRTEAGVAGDEAQVAICDRALAGDEAARVECQRVIEDAEVQS